MEENTSSAGQLLHILKERAKELNCLYQVEELLSNPALSLPEIFNGIIERIPSGWQYPEICQVMITYEGATYMSPGFINTIYYLDSNIRVDDKNAGRIKVSYNRPVPRLEEGFFFEKEIKLINTIADRIGQTIFHKKIAELLRGMENAKKDLNEKITPDWQVIINLLKKSDLKLFTNISRKMIYHLFRNGIQESEVVLRNFSSGITCGDADRHEDMNYPIQKNSIDELIRIGEYSFELASKHFSGAEILAYIQKWIDEDKISFLMKAVDKLDTPLGEIIDALNRYKRITEEINDLPAHTETWLCVELIRRFFSSQLEFIKIAKQNIEITDFYDLIQNIIFPDGSYGRLGGKSTGLFLAYSILKKSAENDALFQNLKIPKTWYIATDGIRKFLQHNNMEEINEHKYKEIHQIRIEYPNIIQLFKNAGFPTSLMKSLSDALDNFGDSPLIVRSSSLLEDSLGTAFSGKYKSLFLANQGTKKERLSALCDAISEVYASVFGPDPIEYKLERGLIDFHEEMGIMIQEVVGRHIGKYFFPSFAGVAFSNNEFRWSPRILRRDGLLRIVPGIGTRAVDRLSDDYPVMISPGQPQLRVNVTPDEIKKYSPRKIDVLNLEENRFETVDLRTLLRHNGGDIPGIEQMVSVFNENMIRDTSLFSTDFEKDELVVTFEGIIKRTPFISQITTILSLLSKKMNTPVDIEFASDGKDLYLLQCRPQSSRDDNFSSPIPKNISPDRIIFNARRYISNGRIPDITHIVYVNPEKYSELGTIDSLVKVGRAVSRLNALLPKRRFILMGPGRWGSRGDIKLGIQVTYSDINNTAVLIELAHRKNNYVPELSFGTHFFQDLVESSIRYIPLYPDEPDVLFNETFFTNSRNILPELLPEYEELSGTVQVIDVQDSAGGKILRILMNADISEAVAYLEEPEAEREIEYPVSESRDMIKEDFRNWRLRMIEEMAFRLDPDKYGIRQMYISGDAIPGQEDRPHILIHFSGNNKQKEMLESWMEGWSLSLSDMYFLQTGYRIDSLLEINIITDDDIELNRGYAANITSSEKQFRLLNMKKKG